MRKLNLNWRVISVISKRDLKLYFSSPTGYLFITVFIFLSAAAAFWQDRFFANNLANLDQLNSMFPYLLLIFIPAVTMNVWAEERRQGTDELLLTIPATDIEIVLGKYLSVLGIYSASLVLSFSHIIVLFWLGSPDLGLMISNYFGYWLIGAAFLGIGMLASLLTSNATIGFILGMVFCSIFIFIGSLEWLTGEWLQSIIGRIAVEKYLKDFARGVISFSGLFYFIGVSSIMVYLNVIILGKRHWPATAGGYKMWIHYFIRTVALIIAVFSFVAIVATMALRIDVTAEGLHSLSDTSRQLLNDLPEDKQVLIQAYISPEVPRNFVESRANIIGKLEEIAAVSGDQVQILIKDTEPFSEEAREAREKFNIMPQETFVNEGGRSGQAKVFLGVALTCGAREEVIPFFDIGLPVEYELIRSIRSVAQSDRKKIGILSTGVKLFGDFNYQTGQQVPPWPVVGELHKQYEVLMVNPTEPIAQKMDVLLAVMPSTMGQEELDNLKNYIKAGNPTVLLIDPMPLIDISLSPILPSDAQVSMFQQNQQQKPPKGDMEQFMKEIGVPWKMSEVIWDVYNPHPDLSVLQQEIIFIGEGNKNKNAFNRDNPVSADLQEVVFMFPGYLEYPPEPNLVFEPLLQTGLVSGVHHWYNLVQRGFFGLNLNPRPRRMATPDIYTVAARISGTTSGNQIENDPENKSGNMINLLIIADVDFISQQFFEIRNRGIANLNFDNIGFFLNSIDYLADDKSFVELRNRRVKHRTLTAVEAKTQEFITQRLEEERQAEEEARKALSEAQQRLNEKVAGVRNRTDVDEQTKQIMAQNMQEVENKRFEAMQANIEANRDATIARSQENTEIAIRAIQANIKTLAVLLPPVPVFVLGVMKFIRRRRREHEGTIAARRLRS
ncbi:MAG: Gldg family protein [Candidatus Zixiibacteriota bacterium]